METHLIDEIINDLSINSLRDFITKKGSTTLNVIDPGILLDVDTMDDYIKALSSTESSIRTC